MSFPLNPLSRCIALLAFAAAPVLAAEHAPEARPAAASAPAKVEKAEKMEKAGKAADKVEKAEKAAPRAEHAASAETEVAPVALPKPRVVRDPIDVIRERLAEKLANPKATEPAPNNELHVVSNVAMTQAAHGAAGATAVAPNAPGAAIASVRPPVRRAPRAVVAKAEALPVVVPVSEAPREAAWDYQGLANPEAWGQLKPEYAKCSSGTRQSPIDIRDGIKVQLDPVAFAYRESGFSVVDTGRTVRVDVSPGNSIEVMGRRYDLVRFDFQRPSEERINGRQYDMGVHLVHRDAEGREAIVAIVLDRGAANPIVQKVWNNLPLEKGDTVQARIGLDIEGLLPKDRRYFTYMGSQTTPPCTEGVLWMVMKQPVEVTPEQVAIFSRLYPMNARPIQQAAGRLIKESN